MTLFLLKTGVLWLGLLTLAILNGLLREFLLEPRLGPGLSLPLSGVSLSLLVLGFSWLCLPVFGRQSGSRYLAIGLLWVLLTLLFEWLFGLLLVGKTWLEIAMQFNPLTGDLFLMVVAVTLVAPRIAARLRGYL